MSPRKFFRSREAIQRIVLRVCTSVGISVFLLLCSQANAQFVPSVYESTTGPLPEQDFVWPNIDLSVDESPTASEEEVEQVAFEPPFPSASSVEKTGQTNFAPITSFNASPCDLQARHCDACDVCGDFFRIRQSTYQAGGWWQQGVTLNPDDPRNRLNAPVLFNDRANDYQMNQLYFYAGKTASVDGSQWDWGGRIDLNYGTDSRFVTVPGLEEHDDRTPRWNSETSDYGLAVPQVYVDLGTPIGPYGSTIRLGHFYALGGYETFAAPENFFYSHAYTYLYGEPFTHSGGMWFGKLTPTLSAAVAGTTGWDSLYTDLSEWGVRAGLLKTFNAGKTTIALTGHGGDDFTGIRTAAGTSAAPRAWASLVMKHFLSPNLYYVLQGDYGYQQDAVVVLDNGNNTVGFGDANWYGINQYLVYQWNQKWSAGMRVEWFRDDGNSRVGLPIEYVNGGPAFNGSDYFSLTTGINYKPHPSVLLRTELRYDSSDVESNPAIPGGVAGIHPFDDRSDDDQLTIAMDAILMF
ncbi:outer membrane beta-barrel protein [Stieleria varia]|uniref:Porin n=1 Tax=Stieleria varia TaxID=2528005 RepID=A0A5C6B8S5_9BACT|nr:outer membrane beta-barrel protein [Stieleria varia]TWU08483.1 hypothetical protein Pla52n_10660 [Stieleria varia]